MAQYYIQGETLSNIADAIREKNGRADSYTPNQMASAILALPVGEGGAAAFNFEIVNGLSQPNSPTENMIWVKTDSTIFSWAFSNVKPSYSEGLVWIKTSLDSGAIFNALKTNSITIAPIADAYICSGNSWIKVETSIYQGGEWKPLSYDLYNEGNQFTWLTGGYITHYNTGDYGAPSIEFLEDRIKLTTAGGSSCVLRTTNKIDLTDISTLVLQIDSLNATSNGSFIRFFVTSKEITAGAPTLSDGTIVNYEISSTHTNNAIEMLLDVSAINERMYVYVIGYSKLRLGTNDFCVKLIRGE